MNLCDGVGSRRGEDREGRVTVGDQEAFLSLSSREDVCAGAQSELSLTTRPSESWPQAVGLTQAPRVVCHQLCDLGGAP